MKRTFFLTFSFMFLLTGCFERASDLNEEANFARYESGQTEAFSSEDVSVQQTAAQVSGVVRPDESVNIEKKLIKTATLEVEVDDYENAIASMRALLSAKQAEISSEEERQLYGRIQNVVSIRVPVDRFDELIEEIEQLGVYVAHKQVNARDVTEEFVDVQARLQTKKAVEARFREILNQARTIEEILNVENQLRVIREEIESTEGRLRYLNSQATLSTIRVTFYERIHETTAPGESFFSQLADSFASGWVALVAFILVIVELWPFWILAGIAVWLFSRWKRLRKSAANEKEPESESEST